MQKSFLLEIHLEMIFHISSLLHFKQPTIVFDLSYCIKVNFQKLKKFYSWILFVAGFYYRQTAAPVSGIQSHYKIGFIYFIQTISCIDFIIAYKNKTIESDIMTPVNQERTSVAIRFHICRTTKKTRIYKKAPRSTIISTKSRRLYLNFFRSHGTLKWWVRYNRLRMKHRLRC